LRDHEGLGYQGNTMSHPARRGSGRIVLLALALLVSACAARREHRPPASAGERAQLLFVQAAHGVSFTGGQLTLHGVSPTTLFFSDRPTRIAGHVLTRRFLADWAKGADSFATDPPNATLSVFGSRTVADAVVELSRPRLQGDDLVYEARVLSGVPPERGGPASLFIDADASVVVPPLLARPELRRPFAWDSYVYDPNTFTGPPPSSSAGVGPYGDLTDPAYYGENPYADGFAPSPPPRAYTFE
jgi:hypothetical protein